MTLMKWQKSNKYVFIFSCQHDLDRMIITLGLGKSTKILITYKIPKHIFVDVSDWKYVLSTPPVVLGVMMRNNLIAVATTASVIRRGI